MPFNESINNKIYMIKPFADENKLHSMNKNEDLTFYIPNRV